MEPCNADYDDIVLLSLIGKYSSMTSNYLTYGSTLFNTTLIFVATLNSNRYVVHQIPNLITLLTTYIYYYYYFFGNAVILQ